MDKSKQIKALLFQRKLFLLLASAITVLWIIVAFVDWIFVDVNQLGLITFIGATIFWVGFGNVNYQLNKLS